MIETLLVLFLAASPQPTTQPAGSPHTELETAIAELQAAQAIVMERAAKDPAYVEAKGQLEATIAAFEAAKTDSTEATARLELAKKKLAAQSAVTAVIRKFQDADPEYSKAAAKVEAARAAIKEQEAQRAKEEKEARDRARREKTTAKYSKEDEPKFMDVPSKKNR